LTIRRPAAVHSLLDTLGFHPRPDVNPAAVANVLPVVLYVVARQLAGTQIAIAVALIALLALFVVSRRVGVLRILASITVVVAIVAGAIGVALNSDFAFLLREPIGDLLAAALLLGSLIVRRPLVGLIAHEVSPRAMHGQDLRLSVFYWLTVAWLCYVLTTSGFRIFLLLEDISPESYLIWTRTLSWPLSAVLLGLSAVLTARRVRARPAAARATAA
jgi:intracellular septation protein A